MKQEKNETKLIGELILEELRKLQELRKESKKETYLTRKDVAKMLQVDASTVHNWTKRKILISYGIGGRVYYKLSQIEDALINLNNDEKNI